jgi:hypothetical protein
MKNSLPLIIAGTIAATTLGFFSPNPVRSQAISIGVSPLVTISELKGSQVRASFSVSNKGNVPVRARIYTQDFEYDKEKGYVAIGDHSNSAKPYLQFSPKELVVAPGVTREVRVNITIPPGKPDGEYRIAVFTEDLTERKITDPTQKYITIVRPQIASVFFVTKGNVTAQVSATSVGWNKETKAPRIVLKNQGRASGYPTVVWKLEQGGKAVANSEIQGVIVQGGKERAIDLRLDDKVKLAAGQYKLVGKINGGGQEVPFALDLNVPAK